jgi:elongation factor P
MATANDMRRGMAIKFKNDIYVVKEFHHNTPGNKRGMVQTQLKSIKTGKIISERFRSTEEIDVAYVNTTVMQYLYEDATGLVFMDNESYEQVTVSKDLFGERAKFLTDNIEVRISFHEGTAIDFIMPGSVSMKITFTPPGEKGDTVSNVTKTAEVDGGFEVQVPLFIKPGDRIKIDTSTGEYVGKD